MLPGCLVAHVRPQHAAELLDQLSAIEPLHIGAGDRFPPPGRVLERLMQLGDPEMARRKRGDLRQVRDAQHLAAA
jgi:hypothetical protein